MIKTCIICTSAASTPVFREFEIDVVRCRTCGHVFSSYIGDQDYDRYFGTEPIASQHQFWWDEAHQRMYDAFCNRFLLGRTGTLLDVGCGLGYFVRRVSRVAGWEAFGCEMSRPAVEFARQALGVDSVFAGRVQDAPFEQGSFDVITLWDVIEHIPDPDPLLSHLCSILKPSGLLFIHTPNIRVQLPKARVKRLIWGMRPGVHYLEAKDHAHIYSTKTIAVVLRRNGFNEVAFTHVPPIQSVSGSRHPLLKLAKNTWYSLAVALSRATRGRFNVDNLSVIARKGTRHA